MPSNRFSPARLALLALIASLALVGCRTQRYGNVSAAPPVIVSPSALESAYPLATAAPASSLTLDLTQCLQMAYERQPRVSTARATLAAAQDGERALSNLRPPASLDHQIPIRCQQSCLGVKAAAAGLDKVEHETAYAVVRNYYTVLYAREQEKVAKKVVENLASTKSNAEIALKNGDPSVTTNDLSRTGVYLGLAETKLIEATQGVKRAMIALREAIGLGPDCTLGVPVSELPRPSARPDRDGVVAAALMRRGDLVQATLFAEIACLEVDAQATSHLQRMQTFAAGSDIHSMQVPQGSNETDYRPPAVPPEMPALLVGTKAERMKHAETLKIRAMGMVETTRNLIALEAEDAYLRWQQASEQTLKAKEAADAGEKYANDLKRGSITGLKVKIEDLVTSQVLASQAQSQFNEFLYKQIIALANLERITAGGFSAGLNEPTPKK